MKRIPIAILMALIASALYAQTSEKQLFLDAEGRFQSGDYELALQQYDRFLSSYPLSTYVPDVQFRRAVSLFRLDKVGPALDLFQLVRTRYAQTRFLPYVPFWIALCEYQLKQYSAASADFDEYLGGNDDTYRNQALLYKAISQRALGQDDGARLSLSNLMNRVSNPASEPYALTVLASLDLQANDYAGVLDLLANVDLSQIPDTYRTRLELYKAQSLFGRHDWTNAEPVYTDLLKASPEIASIAYQHLFTIYQAGGDTAKLTNIVNSAELALAGMPSTLSQFWLRVGIDSFKQGKTDLAESYLQRVWGLRSSLGTVDPLVPLYLAQIYATSGRTSQALDLLKTALPDSGTYRDLTMFKIGGLQLSSGAVADAKATFDTFLSQMQGSQYYAEAAYLDAYSAFLLGDYAGCEAIIDKTMSQASAGDYNVKMLKLKSLAQMHGNDDPGAMQTLNEYLPLAADDMGARVDLIKLAFQQKQYESVLSDIVALDKANPDFQQKDPGGYLVTRYLGGLAAIELKQYQRAAQQLGLLTPVNLAAAGLSSLQPYALFYEGWATYRLADYAGALTVFQSVMESKSPPDLLQRTYYLAGWCAYLKGDYGAAGTLFLKYASASSGEERIRGLFMSAKSASAAGSYDAAEVAFQNIWVESPKSDFADDAMYEYAASLASADKAPAAAQAFQKMASAYPNSPLVESAMYRRGELYYQAKDYENAKAAFRDYRQAFPSGSRVDAALYWGGRASLDSGEDFGAVLLWQELIDDYKNSSLRADAMQRTAGVYADKGDLRKALDLYNELIAVYPKEAQAIDASDKAQKIKYLLVGQSDTEAELLVTIGKQNRAETAAGRAAMLQLARIYIYKSGDRQDQALPLLQEVIAKKPVDSESAAQAYSLLGEYYYRAGDLSRAANEFLTSATTDPSDGDLSASSLYRAAQIAQQAGNTADAVNLANRIQSQFPSTEWATEAKKLIGGGQ